MIDLIIITYDAKDKLRLCLKSVEKQTRRTDYLLTIVNNNSTDGTFQFLERYRKRRSIQVINTDKNLGFSGGANLALKKTRNKFIALLDDDVEVTEKWLAGLYRQIKNKPNVGMVGPKIISPCGEISSADYRLGLFRLIGCGEADKGQRDYIRECDALIGPCWLMRRKIIEKVGYFDERFFPSQHEDIDYCLRVRLAGYKIIYNGKVDVVHHHLSRDGELFNENLLKFFKKWKALSRKYPFKDSHPLDKHAAYGIGHIENKRFGQALCEFRKAEAIDKRFSEPLYVGLALKGLGRFDDAIIEFKKLLDLNPGNARAHYQLALVYRKMGYFKEAGIESGKTFDMLRDIKNGRIYSL